MYKFVKSQPVAKFFYQGTHSHPVRRTVIVIEQNSEILTGYELREGMTTRNLKQAPVKSYHKNKIVKINQIDARRKLRKISENSSKSTLIRQNLEDLFYTGV